MYPTLRTAPSGLSSLPALAKILGENDHDPLPPHNKTGLIVDIGELKDEEIDRLIKDLQREREERRRKIN